MDWSKIKTIFIISFLLLDIYLTYEFFKIRAINQYEVQTEASLEKKLKADEIKYVLLPQENLEDHYLKAKPKVFTNEEVRERVIFADQTIDIVNDTVLKSVLNKPMELKDKFEPSDLNNFIKGHVLYGDQYRFWAKSDDGTTITYYQQVDNKMLFENSKGELTFYLNGKNEVITYEQTYLEKVEELSEPEKIIQPLQAIETLYDNGDLKPKSSITKVELGYYTLVPLSDTTQVLNPAWCFVIDDKERLFVSAFEGKIVQLNNEEKNVVE